MRLWKRPGFAFPRNALCSPWETCPHRPRTMQSMQMQGSQHRFSELATCAPLFCRISAICWPLVPMTSKGGNSAGYRRNSVGPKGLASRMPWELEVFFHGRPPSSTALSKTDLETSSQAPTKLHLKSTKPLVLIRPQFNEKPLPNVTLSPCY